MVQNLPARGRKTEKNKDGLIEGKNKIFFQPTYP
jgi:hypothetical protein